MIEQLSKQAKRELKKILIKDAGLEAVNKVTDEQLNRFGVLCLTITKNSLKIKAREEDKLS